VDNTEYKKYQSKVRDRKSGEIKIVDTTIAQNIQKSIFIKILVLFFQFGYSKENIKSNIKKIWNKYQF
jgi:hypothetical protein